MTISRAVYVSCDVCGTPASVTAFGGADEARAVARGEGFTRHSGKDLCRQCAFVSGTPARLVAAGGEEKQ